MPASLELIWGKNKGRGRPRPNYTKKMTIYKLAFPKSTVNRNEVVGVCFGCYGISDAQQRGRTRRGLPVSDYFVTADEWSRIYSPEAQKANLGRTQSDVRGDRESLEIVN